MQDRLKSRIWDKTEKVMHYNDYVLTATGHIAKIQECSNDNSIMYFNQTDLDFEKDKILMFCTGLKDKNGKLIYEGDIVKIGNGSINGSVIETTREVKWIINTWNVPVWVVDKPNFSHYVEVIGNIYENKELLNESECKE